MGRHRVLTSHGISLAGVRDCFARPFLYLPQFLSPFLKKEVMMPNYIQIFLDLKLLCYVSAIRVNIGSVSTLLIYDISY